MVPLARIELAQTQIRNLVLYPLSYRGVGPDVVVHRVEATHAGNPRAGQRGASEIVANPYTNFCIATSPLPYLVQTDVLVGHGIERNRP